LVSPELAVKEDFWKKFFIQLERNFDWNLTQMTDEIIQIQKFNDEGDGLNGIKVYYDRWESSWS
jgi:hypothetical protein